MSYIEEFCDSIAIINAGKVALAGDLYDIKRNYVRDKLVVSSPTPEKIKKDFGEAAKDHANGTLLIKLPSPEAKRETMKRLIENYDIDEVKVFEPSLGDIFVEYAGEQI
jgi:ABC-2 type transport system ATP-binding protein